MANEILSENDYWNSLYGSSSGNKRGKIKSFLNKTLNSYWKRVLLTSYSNTTYKTELFAKYLSRGTQIKYIEIGSAPGYVGIEYKNLFGYEIFGLEYTKNGVELNKMVYAENGINPNNVIEGSILDEKLVETNKDRFDVVNSVGLIEHFTDPKMIIDNHIKMLKRGGYLIIVIPNLLNLNMKFIKFFNKKNLDIHNLTIMKKEKFSELFDIAKVEEIYCDYWGFFTFGLFNTDNNIIKKFLFKTLFYFERIFINPLLNIFFSKAKISNAKYSPYLVYFGKKK